MDLCFFEQAVKRAVKLDWLIVVEIDVDGDSTTRTEDYGHKIPTWMLYVHTLGEPGTGFIGKNGRLCDTGITTTCVGHAAGHAGDVYRMWN